MAIQKGVIRLKGSLGDLNFYKKLNKDFVRKKASSKPQTENSKKSARDFGTASKYGAYIRKAFKGFVEFYGDETLMNRLTNRLIAVLKAIPEEKAGCKKLVDGHIALFGGFEFNQTASFNSLWLRPTELRIIDRENIQIRLFKGNTREIIKPFAKAQEVRLQVSMFSFELAGDTYQFEHSKDLVIPLQHLVFSSKALNISVDLTGDRAILVAIGMAYYTDGTPSGGRRYQACKIAHALHVRDGQIIAFVEQPKVNVVPVENSNLLDWDDLE